MILLVASIVGGITLGGIYTLISLGLVFAYRATRIFNFAQGELLLLPALIVGYLQARHTSFGVSIVSSLLVSGVIGALFYFLVLRRMVGRPLFMGIIATLGLASILDGVTGIWFPNAQYSIAIPHMPSGSIKLLSTQASEQAIIIAFISFALSAAVALIVNKTPMGLRVRAAGLNPTLASQCGVRIQRIYVSSWVICSVLAAVGGILYASETSADTTLVGIGLAALPAVVVGGMDSIGGCIVGGTLIGVIQGFGQTYLGGAYVNILTFGVLVLVLLVYPQGMFGTKEVVRA